MAPNSRLRFFSSQVRQRAIRSRLLWKQSSRNVVSRMSRRINTFDWWHALSPVVHRLVRTHYSDFRKRKEAEHEGIVYCKANPDRRIIEAIAVVFKNTRAKLGIEMKP